MRTSIRRPRQGPALTRPINHVQRVRAPGLRSQGPHQILTTFPVAAEYLAKGYVLSDQILQRAIELDRTCLSHRPHRSSRRPSFPTEKQGISKRFLDYFHAIDKNIGQRAIGPDQTISGKVQSSVSGGISQARAFDEQKGVTKKAGDVSALLPLFVPMWC